MTRPLNYLPLYYSFTAPSQLEAVANLLVNNTVAMSEIVLRDLQSVLRKQIGSELLVDEFDTLPLVVPGENYSSSIFKVRVLVRDNESAKPRELNLVAKMLPPSQFQRQMVNSSATVQKEIFFYNDLFPAYQKLERDCGVEETDVLDILPKFCGARLSLAEEPNAEVDEDSVILLEDLKEDGFYICDRMQGECSGGSNLKNVEIRKKLICNR